MKTPKFWQKKSIISILLLPFSLLYLIIFSIKNNLTKGKKINKKVICIGNLTMGGSGKTPTALAIGKILQEMSVNFSYLSRGYKGSNKGIFYLNKDQHYDSKVTGDEPLLLKEIATTVICKNRLKAAIEIDKKNDVEAIILDDGMQNRSLVKDLTLLVIDSKLGFGNNMLFPSGPLRQTIQSGIEQSDLIVIIDDKTTNNFNYLPTEKIITAQIIIKNIEKFKNDKLLAFCGLAYPHKFFDLLKKNGLNIVKNIKFADHFQYNEQDLQKICQSCQKNHLTPITTKKDWVKFPKKYQDKISYLDIELVFDDSLLIKNKISKILKDK